MKFRLFPLLAAALVLMTLGACRNGQLPTGQDDAADSLIRVAEQSADGQRVYDVIDSLEQAGQLNSVRANYKRGQIAYMNYQDRLADMYYRRMMRGAIHADKKTYESYAAGVTDLARVLEDKRHYSEALELALQLARAWRENPVENPLTAATRSNLFPIIGTCYVELHRPDAAEAIFKEVYDDILREAEADPTGRTYYYLHGVADDARVGYNNQGYHDQAMAWSMIEEDALNRWASTPDGKKHADDLDDSRANLYVHQAELYLLLKKPREAATAYQNYLGTEYANSMNGRINRISYLGAKGDYQAAADLCPLVDTLLSKRNKRMTFDVIKGYLSYQYSMYRKAHRDQQALKTADRITAAIDSALVWQKQDATAELATIYETQEKEQTIIQQKASLSRQRYAGLLIAFGLVTLFLVVYSLYRRKAQQRLAVAHEELKIAYDQLEETTTAKERIESELRIARDIQMSMVPSVFPEREGLDLYASMMPAREVGGDLYDYLLSDHFLYFCLGDVSGKGVPASLFMAQAIRLFRALAKQQAMPATIAMRLNEELSENNENGMFVTMFIGLVDLTTGHLDFCNAGHNPPVVGGDAQGGSFLSMEANAPIGLWPGLEYKGEELATIKGRPLFIYSDGLTEAENPQQQQFGDEHLLDILRQTHYRHSRQVIEMLSAEVEHHRDGADPNDDLTMMCLRVG